MRPHTARLGDKTLRDLVMLKCNKRYIWSLKMHNSWWMMTFAGRYCTCKLQLVFLCLHVLLCFLTDLRSWSCEFGPGLARYGLGPVVLVLVLWTRSCSHHWGMMQLQLCRWKFSHKLCSRLLSSFDRSWILLAKTAKSRFVSPFGWLIGVT